VAESPRGRLDGVRLAVGTLTTLRVPPPSVVDRRTARTAMLLAPAAGLVPAGGAALVVWACGRAGLAPLLSALLGLGAAALLTRGLHLDGLADTADGLAAGYDRERALAVMRRGDLGPAGAATLVLVLGVQAASLAQVPPAVGPAAAFVGLTAGRLAVTLGCVRGLPAARPDGLGAAVAGSVPVALLAVAAVVVAALSGGATALAGAGALPGVLAVIGGLAAAGVLLARCVRRLGGVSGDVLGACVEVATAAALVSVAATL